MFTAAQPDQWPRNADRILKGTLLPEIAGHVLERMADGRAIHRIKVTADKRGDFKYAVQ